MSTDLYDQDILKYTIQQSHDKNDITTYPQVTSGKTVMGPVIVRLYSLGTYPEMLILYSQKQAIFNKISTALLKPMAMPWRWPCLAFSLVLLWFYPTLSHSRPIYILPTMNST
jgi:hypothetical protein